MVRTTRPSEAHQTTLRCAPNGLPKRTAFCYNTAMFVDSLLLRILCVGAGSALGGMLRYAASVCIPVHSGFPWHTFSVNVFGSLLIGLFSGIVAKCSSDSAQLVRCFAIVGICGGFTTFSTFSNETFKMLESSQWGLASAYVMTSVICGVAAVFLGYMISR